MNARFLGISYGRPILLIALKDDSVGNVGVNWEGHKPLIHYRLIEVNIENSHLTAPFYDYICGGCKKLEKLISKTKSKYYYYRSSG